jgi:hypothetical protein
MRVRLKAVNIINLLFFSVLFLSLNSNAQKDSAYITKFRNNFIVYNDLGFNTAPFNITSSKDKLPFTAKFRNNIHDFYGIGCNYRIFSVRVGVQIPGSIKSTKNFGNSKFFHLGLDFSYKKVFFDFDFYQYKGFALLNGYNYDSTYYNHSNPNIIYDKLTSNSLSVNMWYFQKKNFTMSALRGKTAVFNKLAFTWYLKSTVNSFGLNNYNNSILPDYLIDSTNRKTLAHQIQAFDIGLIPGFAFAFVKNNWNLSILSGYGLVFQNKRYLDNQSFIKFLGFAPRFDIRVMGGYNKPNWFFMVHTDFDNKSIQFTDFKYTHTYLSIRLVGGYRFGESNKQKNLEFLRGF